MKLSRWEKTIDPVSVFVWQSLQVTWIIKSDMVMKDYYLKNVRISCRSDGFVHVREHVIWRHGAAQNIYIINLQGLHYIRIDIPQLLRIINFYLQSSNISSAGVNLALYECEKPGTSSCPRKSDIELLPCNICLDPVRLKWSSSTIAEWKLKMFIKEEEESDRSNKRVLYNKLNKRDSDEPTTLEKLVQLQWIQILKWFPI